MPQSTQGCKVGVTLNISASPKVELPEVTTGCAGTPVSIAPKVTFVDLPIQSGFNPVQITNVWSDGSIGGELITSAAGSYTLTVSSYQIVNGIDITCSVEDATFIQFAPDYNLTATASNSSPNIGDNITLTATVDLPSGAFANVSYLWEAGLPTENIVDFPTNFWTKLTFMANDIFTVTSDVDGCKKSATIKLEAAPTAQNCLPIGFSPTNGDGVNDIYEAKDACNQEIGEWCITNLEAADVACGRGAVNWDGKHFQTQVLCPRGQYICYIKSIVENGELVKLQKPLSSTFDLN